MNNATQVLQQYTAAEGEQYSGLYHDLVKAMLEELDEEFTPEYRNNFSTHDGEVLLEIMRSRSNELVRVKCPPSPAGMSLEAQQAYDTKCCEEKKRPVADKLVSEMSCAVGPQPQ